MRRKLSLFIGLLIGVAFLAGCYEEFFMSRRSYFHGAVIAEYKRQSSVRGTNDYLIFRFYERGTYEITFSARGEGDRSQYKVPQDITEVIEVAPREIIVERQILPEFLRITITKDGKLESHNFFPEVVEVQ